MSERALLGTLALITVYPEDTYLASIGRLAYAAASLEWLLLGDLGRHADVLPANLTVEKLAGEPMGRIAGAATAAAAAVDQPAVAAWLRAAGEHLSVVADYRNHLLHARPATIDGVQRLYRWRRKRESADTFPITGVWLETTLAEIERRHRELDRLRIAAARARGYL